MPVGRRTHKYPYAQTPTDTSEDKPESRQKKQAKPPLDLLLLKDMETMIRDAFKSYRDQGGGQMFDDELMADKKFRQVFIKELFALSKKYFDILAAKMRIEADKESDKNGANGVKPVTNIFVIKGLHEVAQVIDVTNQAQVVEDGPKRLELKGLETE
jgi:hypothetical protein